MTRMLRFVRAMTLLPFAALLMFAGCASSTGVPSRIDRGAFHIVGLDDARVIFDWRGQTYRTDPSTQIHNEIVAAVAGLRTQAQRDLTELAVTEGWHYGSGTRFLVVRVGEEYLIARPLDAAPPVERK